MTSELTYVFRLSRIGDALPVSHIYPHGSLDERGDERRTGAQAFRALDEVIVELQCGRITGGMVPGADRLLMIRTYHGLPHDESGWAILTPEDVIEVRSLPLPADPAALMTEHDDDDALFAAGAVIAPEWKVTV